MSCDKQILINNGYPTTYGDYDCDGIISFQDISHTIITRYADTQELSFQDIYRYIEYYVKSAQGTEIKDIMETILQTESSQDSPPPSPVTGCMDSGATNYNPEATQAGSCTFAVQTSKEKALAALDGVDTSILAIVNVPKNPGTPADGYDIFFKGPEVLEYQVTFSGSLKDQDENILITKQRENINVFHNLFTDTSTYSEQAFVIDGSKVYQARRSNTNADKEDTASLTPWSDTDLIHMFSTTGIRTITRVDKVRYTDAVDEDIVTNAASVSIVNA